jgi:hypothetical protein
VGIDPFLPSFVCPAGEGECYVVRGREVGRFVEISLSRDVFEHHRFRRDTHRPVELVALKRFSHGDSKGYVAYANRLEDAARYAARGELGYFVDTVADGASVRVSLVARLLDEEGGITTEISHEHRFEEPDSHTTLVETNEKAAELRARAQELNDSWVALRQAQLLELQASHEQADAQAASARDLERIVDAEAE